MNKQNQRSFQILTAAAIMLAAGSVMATTLSAANAVAASPFHSTSTLSLAAAKKPRPKSVKNSKSKTKAIKNAGGLPARIKNMRRTADRLLMDVRDVSAARREYKRILEAIDRNDPYYNMDIRETITALAMCDAADGDFAAAEPVFRREYENSLKRRGADIAKWHALLSLCKAAGRDFKAGKSNVKDAVIADCLMSIERYADAEKLYSRSLGAVGIPRDVKAYVLMQKADCLAKMGRPEDALKQYQTLQKDCKSAVCAPRAMLRAGVLCVGHLDNDKLGCDFFSFIEDSYPDSEFAEQALFYRLTVAIWGKKWNEARKLRKLFMDRHPLSSKTGTVRDEYGQLIAKRLTALPDK